VKLLNDLEALAYGSLVLAPEDLHVLHAGASPPRKGNVAVIAAGTGLGEAFLIRAGDRYHPVASEGGHADFAPRTDQEIALLRHLREKLGGRVSYERVVSGPGLVNVYEFLRESGAAPLSPGTERRLASEDPAAVISELGLPGTRSDPLCAAALDLFCSVYGAEAGNLALKCVALGGVIVGGGIAPKILPALARGPFVESFLDKGRYRGLLAGIPVRVALNDRAPLLGAAHYALALARDAD
jgi:glucokinase